MASTSLQNISQTTNLSEKYSSNNQPRTLSKYWGKENCYINNVKQHQPEFMLRAFAMRPGLSDPHMPAGHAHAAKPFPIFLGAHRAPCQVSLARFVGTARLIPGKPPSAISTRGGLRRLADRIGAKSWQQPLHSGTETKVRFPECTQQVKFGTLCDHGILPASIRAKSWKVSSQWSTASQQRCPHSKYDLALSGTCRFLCFVLLAPQVCQPPEISPANYCIVPFAGIIFPRATSSQPESAGQ